jgi:hypothetical protein
LQKVLISKVRYILPQLKKVEYASGLSESPGWSDRLSDAVHETFKAFEALDSGGLSESSEFSDRLGVSNAANVAFNALEALD